jgi:uncharacterized protein (TIGR03435 family)
MPQLPFCVCGVRGGNLKTRVESIMRGAAQRPITIMTRLALASAAIATVAGPLVAGAVKTSAQQPAGITDAAFEVASIRRNVSGSPQERWPNPRPNGDIDVINLRVSDLVQAAYWVGDHQVEGMPAWARNARYDISARLDPRIAEAPQPPGLPPTWTLALQALLKERLQLSFHRKIAQRPTYALVLARQDRKPGPGLRPAEFDCDALKERAAAAARVGGPSPYPQTTDSRIACGIRQTPGRYLQGGGRLIEFTAILSRMVGRPVFDETDLTGRWDVLLTYTPDTRLRPGEAPPADSPDLFTALSEQLGLKLESTTRPIEIFVVDRIEPPSEN